MTTRKSKLLPVCFSLLLFLQSYHSLVLAASDPDDEEIQLSDEDASDSENNSNYTETNNSKHKQPKKRKLLASELELDDEFKDFKNGHRFRPPFEDRGPKRPFGYGAPKDLFRDFHGHECEESENDSACKLDNEAASSEGSVKITFVCDDQTYSYYAKVENSAYSLDIPNELNGLSCKIQIESVKVTDTGTSAIVKGEETSEEIELDSETTVEIDLE